MADKKGNMDAIAKYVEKIDWFAEKLRAQQRAIAELAGEEERAKAAYNDAKAATREAKDYEHEIVALLLKFIQPGSVEILPLFDTMEPAQESVHGANAADWRNEPIVSLNLSAVAMRALIDADIVLVGQLQDRILKGAEWHIDLDAINEGMAQAIEMRLHAFIEERTSK